MSLTEPAARQLLDEWANWARSQDHVGIWFNSTSIDYSGTYHEKDEKQQRQSHIPPESVSLDHTDKTLNYMAYRGTDRQKWAWGIIEASWYYRQNRDDSKRDAAVRVFIKAWG